MNIQTTLSCGDKAWTFDGENIRQRTVGQIRIQYTDSPGIGDGFMEGGIASYSGGWGGVPDNYQKKPPKLVEEYMCVETGIGSGSIYTLGESIFATENECRTANTARLAELAEEKRKREQWQREERIRRLRLMRLEIADLKRHVGMEG